MQTNALSGIRILDLSRLLPGPLCTSLLRDMGASVDKIEDPGAGDYMRTLPPTINGVNPLFAQLNAGNRSAVLDLKTSAGRDALLAILPRYDVLVESFRPGVLERLGLSATTLLNTHPRLIVCSIAGFLPPNDHRAGHDLNFMAESGALSLFAAPTVPGVQTADVGGAMLAAMRICAALVAREKHGSGVHINTYLEEAGRLFTVYSAAAAHAGEDHSAGSGPLNGGLALYNTYRCSDGKWVALAALEPKFYKNLAWMVAVPIDASALVAGEHQRSLKSELARTFAKRPSSEWLSLSQQHECCLSLVSPSPTLPRCGAAPPPTHGEHTADVLSG